MIGFLRQDERIHQDAHDFIVMFKQNPDIGLVSLEKLGDLVFPGVGKGILEKVRQVRAGEKLQL